MSREIAIKFDLIKKLAPLSIPNLSVCHLDLNCSHLSRHNNSSLHTVMKTYVSQIPQWGETISEVAFQISMRYKKMQSMKIAMLLKKAFNPIVDAFYSFYLITACLAIFMFK
jgi:hypothetical protein